MRALLVSFVLFAASCVPALIPKPTGVIVAGMQDTKAGQRFIACEIALDMLWTETRSVCGEPVMSAPWGTGGTCHFYRTNTVGLGTETGAPYIAVCVRHARVPGNSMEAKTAEVVQMVVGLRELP